MRYINNKPMEPELGIMLEVLDSLGRKGLVLRDALGKSLDYLNQLYQATNDRKVLDVALLQIKAFLYMGGSYKSLNEKFDAVLKELEVSRESILLQYSAKYVNATSGQVRGMIGRWMPSKENPMKIQEVVDDIIRKVSSREQGRYLYQYKRKDGKWQQVDSYELVIDSDFAYFHDFGNIRYYIFKQEGIADDKDCSIG